MNTSAVVKNSSVEPQQKAAGVGFPLVQGGFTASQVHMTGKLQSLLTRLTPVVSEEMHRVYVDEDRTGQGMCIETSRCLKIVFRHFGFDSSPVSVAIFIHNPVSAECLKVNAHLSPAELGAELRRTWDKDGHSCGSSPVNGVFWQDGGYNAHVVLRCQNVLVDASVQQYNRPAKNILLPPLIVTPVTPEFTNTIGGTARVEVHGCLIVMARTGDNSFRQSPAWSKRGGRYTEQENLLAERRIVNRIIERVR